LFNKIIFAERLEELRIQKGLTAVALSKAIGVSKQAIGQFEKAANYPHVNTLTALADYFNVSLDYLVGRSDIPYILKKSNVEILAPDELNLLKQYRQEP